MKKLIKVTNVKKLINDIYGYNKKILHVITTKKTKKTKAIDKKDFKGQAVLL